MVDFLYNIEINVQMHSGAEDNLCMLERMIEMVKVKKECLVVAFIDMEKAYDRVNKKK